MPIVGLTPDSESRAFDVVPYGVDGRAADMADALDAVDGRVADMTALSTLLDPSAIAERLDDTGREYVRRYYGAVVEAALEAYGPAILPEAYGGDNG